MTQPRIVIVDRSQLAGNMYRLLLAPLDPLLAVYRRFEEARHRLSSRERTDLLLISSTALGKKMTEVCDALEYEAPLAMMRKIFLIPEEEGDVVRGRVLTLPNTSLMERPFHPDEMLTMITKLLKEGR